MPPPTTITFIAQLTKPTRAFTIMVRKVRPVQRFSRDVVDGTGAAQAH
jgi:hypothetical protein